MRSRATFLLVPLALVLLVALVNWRPPVAQAQAGACGADIDFGDDAPLVRADTDPTRVTVELTSSVPPGDYEILVSTSDTDSRPRQELEQVNVIVDGHVHGPTPDLPGDVNGVTDSLTDYSLGIVTTTNSVNEVIIEHAYAGVDDIGPESLHITGVALRCVEPEPGPDTTLPGLVTIPDTVPEPTVKGTTVVDTTAPEPTVATTTPDPVDPTVKGTVLVTLPDEHLPVTGDDTGRQLAGGAAQLIVAGLLFLAAAAIIPQARRNR